MAIAQHALTHAKLMHQLRHPVFENTGAHGFLDVGTAARIDNDRLDPGPMQQMGEEKTGRPGADNPDLRTHLMILFGLKTMF
jgi:hypothetical protein